MIEMRNARDPMDPAFRRRNRNNGAFFPLALLILVLGSCATKKVVHNVIRKVPGCNLQPPPQKILIASSFDMSSQGSASREDEVFALLRDTALYSMATELRGLSGVEVEVIRGGSDLSPFGCVDLIMKHGATHLFAISSLNVFIEKVGVEVSGTDSTMHREALYDIISDVNYVHCDRGGERTDTLMTIRRFHSSRNMDGFMRFVSVPGSLGNKRNKRLACALIIEDLEAYLANFYPGMEGRDRILFTTKEFTNVGAAIASVDHAAALKQSQRLADAADRKVAAKAHYNCAVLYEHYCQPLMARISLDRSLGSFPLAQARTMLEDYR